jgi:transposase-like protein
MRTRSPDYHGERFPPEIGSNAVWRSHPFSLSFHDVNELLSEYGVRVSYEAVRR